jgi:hypothetical protein
MCSAYWAKFIASGAPTRTLSEIAEHDAGLFGDKSEDNCVVDYAA